MTTDLKARRVSKGYTQKEISNMLGICLRAYQYIEKGEREPSLKVALELQNIFNENINTLLRRT